MKAIATILAAMLAAVLGLPVLAQGQVPAFCHATDPADPAYNIADYDPQRDADDWCKLAYNEPHKARRQVSKAVSLVRTQNNPNRFYFDPKTGAPPGLYIQLLRPWMVTQNAAGTHDWRVTYFNIGGFLSREPNRHRFEIEDASADYPNFRITLGQIPSHDAYYIDEIIYAETANHSWHCRTERNPDDSSADVKRMVEHVLGSDRGPNCP